MQSCGTFGMLLCGNNLEEAIFLLQHNCAHVHKAWSIKTWVGEFGKKELHWPAQSPGLNPNEQPGLYDLIAFHSWFTLINVGPFLHLVGPNPYP